MNRIASTGILLATVATLFSIAGCSSFGSRSEPSPDAVAQAGRIGVYESSPPGPQDYRFVTRLWVEPWRSALDFPRYRSVEAGVADLRAEAVALGGDAIVNFGCYHIAVSPDSDLVCNGTVVKLQP